MLEIPSTIASDYNYNIFTDPSSALKAYESTRAPPKLVVTPQVTPEFGFKVGVNYLFNIIHPPGEAVKWTVSRLARQIKVDPNYTSGHKPIKLKEGTSSTFSFAPGDESRHSIQVIFTKPEINFTDTLTVQVNATKSKLNEVMIRASIILLFSTLALAVLSFVIIAIMNDAGKTIKLVAQRVIAPHPETLAKI